MTKNRLAHQGTPSESIPVVRLTSDSDPAVRLYGLAIFGPVYIRLGEAIHIARQVQVGSDVQRRERRRYMSADRHCL